MALALAVEAVDVGDGAGLVVAAQVGESVGEAEVEGDEVLVGF